MESVTQDQILNETICISRWTNNLLGNDKDPFLLSSTIISVNSLVQVWTQTIVSISWDSNYYTTGT